MFSVVTEPVVVGGNYEGPAACMENLADISEPQIPPDEQKDPQVQFSMFIQFRLEKLIAFHSQMEN